jgi:hypothetical protein
MVVALAALGVGIGTSGGSSAVRYGFAYVTGGPGAAPQVRLAGSSGAHARWLGSGTNPLLAPSGQLVAVSSAASTGRALFLYGVGGGATRQFFSLADATAVAQSWSPDSRYLAVVLNSTDPNSSAASGLAVIDTRTLAVRTVAHGPIYGASFARDGTDRLAYSSAASLALAARVNVHTVGPDGSGRKQLTRDGRSLNPVWGPDGLAFDRERLRTGAAPVYQVWLTSTDGKHQTRLTHLTVPPLQSGLVPLAFSDDGNRLLAEYEGQDTSEAWLISIASHRARRLEIAGQTVTGAAISHAGNTVLVDRGGFLTTPDHGSVISLSLMNGHSRVLAHGSEPSWNL